MHFGNLSTSVLKYIEEDNKILLLLATFVIHIPESGFETENFLAFQTNKSLIIILLMGKTGNGIRYCSYAVLSLKLGMTSCILGLRGPSRRAALPCRSQTAPGDKDMQTYSVAQAEFEGPRLSRDICHELPCGMTAEVDEHRRLTKSIPHTVIFWFFFFFFKFLQVVKLPKDNPQLSSPSDGTFSPQSDRTYVEHGTQLPIQCLLLLQDN